MQNVVGGRQPKLIHLAPEESDEEADEPEVEAITMMLIHKGSEMTRRPIWSPKLTLGSKYRLADNCQILAVRSDNCKIRQL